MAPRLTRRTAVRGALALVCAVSVTTGAFTGTGSAAPGTAATEAAPDGRAVTKTITASCPFADPVGPVKLDVKTEATLPASMTTGKPAAIDGLSVSFALPRAAAQQLLGTGAALEGGLTFQLLLEQGKSKDALVVPLTIAATPMPPEGDVPLVAKGKLAAFSPSAAGVLRIRLSAPELALGPTGAPAGHPAEQVACTTDGGQDLSFGTIAVLAATTPPSGKPAPDKKATPSPRPGTPRRHSLLAEEPPADDTVTTVLPLQPNQVNATSTVVRTGTVVRSSAAALINGVWRQVTDPNGTPLSSDITGEIALAPVRVSFLAYGFLPVSATVEFLPPDYRNGRLIHSAGTLFNGVLRDHLDVVARLSDVEINGAPLRVGPGCVTKEPASIDMMGPYDPFSSGEIGTDPANPDPKYRGFRLPEFTGCGVDEKLSSVFSGLTSGDGNQAHASLAIIALCTEADHRNCPPVMPIPAAVFRAGR
ncbi:DUF6801 domain-containing protein [Amycolatopsis australiensis]|uniref:DUF6801 domain-containing protein n=1 Tax=Amycolatopsis australiensis TaxID=546364 RepID=A0A1K1T4V1_9PSEU|nr:DUF6801 domain-containing protein [Amycolatopsis australiensis]SFW91564.1 hypothetical protein SAMN04489730_8030 [Amycolatopsis australiensis]